MFLVRFSGAIILEKKKKTSAELKKKDEKLE